MTKYMSLFWVVRRREILNSVLGVPSVDPRNECSIARLLLSDARKCTATMLLFDPKRMGSPFSKHKGWPDQHKQILR